eukprot:6213267-Pleurochrysis_carterae.AAC.1
MRRLDPANLRVDPWTEASMDFFKVDDFVDAAHASLRQLWSFQQVINTFPAIMTDVFKIRKPRVKRITLPRLHRYSAQTCLINIGKVKSSHASTPSGTPRRSTLDAPVHESTCLHSFCHHKASPLAQLVSVGKHVSSCYRLAQPSARCAATQESGLQTANDSLADFLECLSGFLVCYSYFQAATEFREKALVYREAIRVPASCTNANMIISAQVLLRFTGGLVDLPQNDETDTRRAELSSMLSTTLERTVTEFGADSPEAAKLTELKGALHL